MKNSDFKGILNAIKQASPAHLALVSLIVFPIILSYWLDSIGEFFPDMSVNRKENSVILIFSLFVICIIWIAIENRRKNKLRLTRDQIMTRLVVNDWKAMSFDSARKVLGHKFRDAKIEAAINEFPETLRLTRVKDKTNGVHNLDKDGKGIYKPAVGRINYVDTNKSDVCKKNKIGQVRQT